MDKSFTELKELLEQNYPLNEAEIILRLLQEHLDSFPEEEKQQQLNRIFKLVQTNTPVQYITGRAWFSDFELHVNEHVLIPRPETDELVYWILKDEQKTAQLNVWDIGTGSGCIALALKKHAPSWNVLATDINPLSLSCAQENAKRLGLDIQWRLHDILNDTSPELQMDIIVSNPPYIPESEKENLEAHVLQEPHRALFVPDDDPLLFYRRIADIAAENLNLGGRLYFELHSNYALQTEAMLKEQGWHCELKRDMQGTWRMIRCTK